MDSPYPVGDASSLVNLNTTPNSAGFASPIPLNPEKKPTQLRRRVVRQRAKPPYQDPDENSDVGHDHGNAGKLPARQPRLAVTARPISCSNVFEYDSKPPTIASSSVFFSDKDEHEFKETNCNPERDRNAPSVNLPDMAGSASQSPGSSTTSNPKKQGFFDMLDLTSNASGPALVSNNQKISSAMRGTVPDIGQDHDYETNALTHPAINTLAQLPVLELDPHDPFDDDDQNVNPFSLTAVPPSRGNSPPTATTVLKGAIRKQPTKNAAKQPKQQNSRKAAQRQRRSSSTSEHNDGDINAVGSDIDEQEGTNCNIMPPQTNFKPLQSPINPNLAATQDIMMVESSTSSSFVDDDDMGDGDFEPTSTLSPRVDDTHQPKTRAVTQGGTNKNASKTPNPLKAVDTNSRRREGKEKSAIVDLLAQAEPKEQPKQVAKAYVAKNTRVSKAEVEAKPKTQVKKATAPVTSVTPKSHQASTRRQAARPQVSGENLQHENDATASKPVTSKTRRRKAGGVGKPDPARQADIDSVNGPRNDNIVAFGRDGPKNAGKSQKPTNAPVLRSPDRSDIPAGNDKIHVPTKPDSVNLAPKVRKQRPTRKEAMLRNHFAELDCLPPQRQTTEGNVHDLPISGADHEDCVAELVHEDGAHDKSSPKPTGTSRAYIDNDAAAAEEWEMKCADDGEEISIMEPSAGEFDSGVYVGNNHQYVPAYGGQEYPATQQTNFLQRNDPAPDAKGAIAAKRPFGTVTSLMECEPLAKKPKHEAVDTVPNSPDEESSNSTDASRIMAVNSSDDVFDTNNEVIGRAKETTFVQRCIGNGSKHYSPVKAIARKSEQQRPAKECSAVHRDERAQQVQTPDNVAQRVLAAISAPENVPRASHDASHTKPGTGSNSGLLEQPMTGNVDDLRRAWSTLR